MGKQHMLMCRAGRTKYLTKYDRKKHDTEHEQSSNKSRIGRSKIRDKQKRANQKVQQEQKKEKEKHLHRSFRFGRLFRFPTAYMASVVSRKSL